MSEKNKYARAIFQQELKRCRIRSTPYCTSVMFFALSVFYAVMISKKAIPHRFLNTYSTRYDEECNGKQFCHVSIDINKTMKQPVYLYYKIVGFIQNHRDIASSYSIKMLNGDGANASDKSIISGCNPRVYINDTENEANLYIPCGNLPYYVFNDTITVLNRTEFSDAKIPLSIDIDKNFKDLSEAYPNSSHWLEHTGIFPKGTANPHFIVWMRLSPFNTFRKLYSISYKNIPAGRLDIDIVNRYNVSGFHGEKWIIISESSDFGSFQNGPLYVFIFMVIMFGVAALLLGFIGYQRSKPNSRFHPVNVKNSFTENDDE